MFSFSFACMITKNAIGNLKGSCSLWVLFSGQKTSSPDTILSMEKNLNVQF